MIAANKRFLKANLTQGVLEIQQNLVQLYTDNLEAVGIQAALIGGFSFSALIADYKIGSIDDDENPINLGDQILSYFFYTCFSISFTVSLYILCLHNVVNIFGPTLALKGSTDDAVKYVATHMRSFQLHILKAACIAISALILGAILVSWAIYDIGVAVLTTVAYLIVYYFIMQYGFSIYRTFNPLVDGVFIEPDAIGHHPDGRKMTAKEYKEEMDRKERERLQEALEVTKLKVKGILWKRQPVEDGGLFKKYFAVLEKGRLDFYKNEKDYRDNANPVNSKPVKLWQYNLELDYRKYQQNAAGIGTAVMSTVVGSEDFTLKDLLKSEYDLQNAARNYKFGLVPKVVSELVATTTHEFLAHDEATYRLWIETFDSVVKAFDEIAAGPSLEQTIRVGTADVELVVQAANNETHL